MNHAYPIELHKPRVIFVEYVCAHPCIQTPQMKIGLMTTVMSTRLGVNQSTSPFGASADIVVWLKFVCFKLCNGYLFAM